MGLYHTAMVCAQEMDVENGLKHCIRVMVSVEGRHSHGKPIFLREAQVLQVNERPEHLPAAEQHRKVYAIAIDGPSGAGKSTIAKMVAKALGFVYIDTGAMYRATALHCLNNGVYPGDEEGVLGLLPELNISIRHIKDSQHIFLQGVDVTHAIRQDTVADGASKVAVLEGVRQKLVAMQRALAKRKSVVMDGRDIGTYVLPNAALKIYLDASVAERARRRVADLEARGFAPDPEQVYAELVARDYRDTNRTASPLRRAQDAQFLLTDGITPDEVTQRIIQAFRQCTGKETE